MSHGVLPPLLLIDKPKGVSSFSVIRELRRRTKVEKMGHAGTLDPLATGLMLIGVGAGTKELTTLIGLDKEYVAHMLLGESRTTSDMEGEVVAKRAYEGDVTREAILAVLTALLGEIELPVSAYSAIKKDGIPMYKRARKAALQGAVVDEVPVRVMRVFEAELLGLREKNTAHGQRLEIIVRFKVGSGTYIRSLVEEIGKRLGYPAVMSDLRRTQIGPYRIEEAQQLKDFGTLWQELVFRYKRLRRSAQKLIRI